MNAAQVHRGPDDEGVYEDPQRRITLGVRRLSIIDIAGGHQPLANEDRTVWVALNGEIYNSPELQPHLRARGHVFRSRTDTETLVHLYEEYGDDLVHALEGMYAFALWDERRGRLLLARDRFGEKPLFLHRRASGLAFASELSALVRIAPRTPELSLEAIDSYAVFGYVPGPATIFSGYVQLAPGHVLTWDAREDAIAGGPYWTASRSGADRPGRQHQIAAETGRLLKRSVARTLISDVPVGVFLSGGVDSGLIAAMITASTSSPPPTFTVGYDTGDVSELAQARRTVAQLRTDHHELLLGQADVADRVPAVLSVLDQPLADPALIPLHALAEMARRHVTVVVGGEGADELFGGYPRYRWLALARRLQDLLPASGAALATRMLTVRALGPRASRLAAVVARQSTAARNLDWVTLGRRHERAALYGPRLRDLADDDRVLAELAPFLDGTEQDVAPSAVMVLDQRHWLPDDVLYKADRAGMLNSLEIRTPYLAREVAEFANGVPITSHLAGEGKALLRHALEGYVEHPRPHRRKTAFRVPGGDWLRGALRPLLLDQAQHGTLVTEGYVDRAYLQAATAAHLGGEERTPMLWPILALGLWLDRVAGRA